MTVEKLERVMWRMRSTSPGKDIMLNSSLHRAVMLEIGTDPRTITKTRKALVKLGWIKPHGNKKIKLTGDDLTTG
jgi:hypothetical protein